MSTDADAVQVRASGPFATVLFRFMFTAAALRHMVTWQYAVAAGLLMTSLSPQPLMTALVQAALSLPSFLFGAHAGAVCDLVDRRRIMLGAQLAMLASALAVLGMSLAGALTSWSLLVLTSQWAAPRRSPRRRGARWCRTWSLRPRA